MPRTRKSFQKIIDQLKALYGPPRPPRITDPFQMILLENIAYLVSDEQREAAFDALASGAGLSPVDILSAPDEVLLEVARLGGMHPDARVAKLKTIAHIALQEFEGDLESALKRPPAQARKALKKFPGIGGPGAEKILLFSRVEPVLALDSNGLRVLVRLGFGEEQKNYASTYRLAQEAVREEMNQDFDWLIAAHQLLRRHGRELCKNSDPGCRQCPLTRECRFYGKHLKENVGDA